MDTIGDMLLDEFEGRYLVWTPCAALQVREWCEPSIATFHNGRWHTYDPPWAWFGPLPVVHGDDCLRLAADAAPPVPGLIKPEYDL